jgi:hypothetical protein
MTYRGRVKDGAIVLDSGSKLPEGSIVRIELESGEPLTDKASSDPLFRMTDLAAETGISDLATNIDHYLYGHPKGNSEGRGRMAALASDLSRDPRRFRDLSPEERSTRLERVMGVGRGLLSTSEEFAERKIEEIEIEDQKLVR